jgi:thiol-disulfide isomerase/thioredoxin
MNKKVALIIAVVFGLFLIGGGALAYSNNQNEKKEQEKMAMEKKTEEAAMMKKEEAAAMEKDKMAKEGDAMVKESEAMVKEDAMSKIGSYVTLADYNKDPSKYADSKKVYFFHASWCPICQGIDKEINADTTKIPAGVTLIKTDFDSTTDLRQKYGVTTQYTFVQVDSNGNETAQWSATSLAKAISGIKS